MAPDIRPTRPALPGGAVRATTLGAGATALLSLAGCVDPPPQYSTTEQYPPVIQGAMVDPAPVRVIYTTAPEIIFNVPFRSVDVGESLQAAFVLDFDPTSTAGLVDQVPVPADPTPFAEQNSRAVNWPWQLTPRPTGCHTMTIILSHVSNFSGLFRTINPLDVAEMTWFFNIGDPNSPAPTLLNCPSTGSPAAATP